MMGNSIWRKVYYIMLAVIALILLQPKGGSWAWMYNIRWFYVLILSAVLAQLFTPIVIRIAWKFNILDYPDSARKLQKKPIPRIGGLAIFAAIIISSLRNFQFSPQLTGLVVGSSIIYIIGFIDDIRPLPATLRLTVQLIASWVVIKGGVILSVFPYYWPADFALNTAITIMWLIGIANAVNFLDGVDGLATSLIATSALLFFAVAWHTRQSYLAFLTISVAGASLGFLPYNWKRATVYLGDAGATFLGFLLAGLAVMGTWAHDNPLVAIASPLLILGIPIFDMIYTTISRIDKGYVKTFKQWLEYAGRDHFHHRLMYLSFSEVQTVLFIVLVNLCLGLGALIIRDTGIKGSILMLTQSVLVFLIIVALMVLGRKAADKNSDQDGNKDIV